MVTEKQLWGLRGFQLPGASEQEGSSSSTVTPKHHWMFLVFISLVEDALFCLKMTLCFMLFLINT